ncbi:hypothetical protein [Agrobacterium sp. 22-226-1]
MRENKMEPYTVEQLQQQYAVSLHMAVEVRERFGGDRSKLARFMKHCPHRDAEKKPTKKGWLEPSHGRLKFADEVLNAPFLPPIFFVLLDLVVWIGGKK